MVCIYNDNFIGMWFLISWLGWSSLIYYLSLFGLWSFFASIFPMSIIGLFGKIVFGFNGDLGFTLVNVNPKSIGEFVFMILFQAFAYIICFCLVSYWQTLEHIFSTTK